MLRSSGGCLKSDKSDVTRGSVVPEDYQREAPRKNKKCLTKCKTSVGVELSSPLSSALHFSLRLTAQRRTRFTVCSTQQSNLQLNCCLLWVTNKYCTVDLWRFWHCYTSIDFFQSAVLRVSLDIIFFFRLFSFYTNK